MNALDLIQLGRRLVRIGEEALRGGTLPAVPTGPSLVLREALAHPGASVGELAERTGLPQGYVSESVARLREQGLLETAADPADGRRTLVRVGGEHLRTVARKGAAPIDAALARSLGGADPEALRETLAALALLAERLGPAEPGPVLERLRAGGGRA